MRNVILVTTEQTLKKLSPWVCVWQLTEDTKTCFCKYLYSLLITRTAMGHWNKLKSQENQVFRIYRNLSHDLHVHLPMWSYSVQMSITLLHNFNFLNICSNSMCPKIWLQLGKLMNWHISLIVGQSCQLDEFTISLWKVKHIITSGQNWRKGNNICIGSRVVCPYLVLFKFNSFWWVKLKW